MHMKVALSARSLRSSGSLFERNERSDSSAKRRQLRLSKRRVRTHNPVRAAQTKAQHAMAPVARSQR